MKNKKGRGLLFLVGWLLLIICLAALPNFIFTLLQPDHMTTQEYVVVSKFYEPIQFTVYTIFLIFFTLFLWNGSKDKNEDPKKRKQNLISLVIMVFFNIAFIILIVSGLKDAIKTTEYFKQANHHRYQHISTFKTEEYRSRRTTSYYVTLDGKEYKTKRFIYEFVKTKVLPSEVADEKTYQVPAKNTLEAEYLTDDQGKIIELLNLEYTYY